jgi:hypothetical protein
VLSGFARRDIHVTLRLKILVTSAVSAFFIGPIYGLQELGKLFGLPREFVIPKNQPPPGPNLGQPRTVGDVIYCWTRRVLQGCGDPAIVLFLAIEECQTKAFGLVFDLLSLHLLRWRQLPKQLGHQCWLAVASVGADRSIALEQAQNTRYIFVLVRNNPERLNIPSQGEFDLMRHVERAYGMGAFESIWTVEGLGHVYTQRIWSLKWGTSQDVQGILSDGQAGDLPDKSLTMMHAGMGLAFAESLLQQLAPGVEYEQVEKVLATFLRLCHNNARKGYVGCALESLGLVTRCFNYPLFDWVQRVLVDLDPVAWEYFWRGAGRGIYFAPAHLAQQLYSPWIAAEQEAPTPQVLEILKSAIAWPTNIVNMRRPEIFERFVLRYGIQSQNEEPIIQGVAASTTMAVDISPGSSVVERYLEHVPTSRDPRIQDLWERLVRRPVYDAVHTYQPILHRNQMMDQVFRFRNLAAAIGDLEEPTLRV